MSAALISKLIECGTPTEVVAEVAMALARAQAVTSLIEERRAKDRERKRIPRNSTETAEIVEIQEKGSVKVSPRNPLPNHSQITPLKGSPQKFLAPVGVTDEQWAAFRKQRRKPLNEHAYGLLSKKLLKLAEDGWPPGDMIDLAIERGWETVFAPRNFTNERSSNPTGDALARVQAAIRGGSAFG